MWALMAVQLLEQMARGACFVFIVTPFALLVVVMSAVTSPGAAGLWTLGAFDTSEMAVVLQFLFQQTWS